MEGKRPAEGGAPRDWRQRIRGKQKRKISRGYLEDLMEHHRLSQERRALYGAATRNVVAMRQYRSLSWRISKLQEAMADACEETYDSREGRGKRGCRRSGAGDPSPSSPAEGHTGSPPIQHETPSPRAPKSYRGLPASYFDRFHSPVHLGCGPSDPEVWALLLDFHRARAEAYASIESRSAEQQGRYLSSCDWFIPLYEGKLRTLQGVPLSQGPGCLCCWYYFPGPCPDGPAGQGRVGPENISATPEYDVSQFLV